MKNSDYWQKRVELTQNILLQKADSFIDDMERSYKEVYNSIENEINVFFQRFAVNEGLSMNEAKKLLNSNEIEKFKMTVEEYIKKGQENSISNMWQKELESASNLYRIDRLKSLQIQINQQIEILSAYKNTGTEKTLKDIFEESYYRNIFDVQQFLGYGKAFEILDTKTINSAIIKPWTYDGETFSQRIWKDNNKLKYSLDKILTQGIIRGSPPDKISKAIAKEMNTSLNNARRLVLTESAVFSTKGRDKSYDELNVDEIEFVASLDEKTCAECGGMDGKHYPRSTGEIGKNLPPLHPYCRCTTAPYFNDEFIEGEERFARDEKGNGYYVPSDMSFEEWKTKYVDNLPKAQIIKGSELKRYSKEEIQDIANTTEKIIDKYINKKSKWSGNIIVEPSDRIYGKRWNCDISTMSETSAHIILHEQLHARSISYFNSDIYRKFSYIEEGAVQFLAQEISKVEKIDIIPSQYDELTDTLRKINSKTMLYESELEFAINLFNIDPSERLDWLESQIYDKLFISGTIEDLSELSDFLDLFR